MKAGLRGMLQKAREARKKKVDEYQKNESKVVEPTGEKGPEESREPEEGREPEESRKPAEKKTKRVPRFFRGKVAKTTEQKKLDIAEEKTDSGAADKEDNTAPTKEAANSQTNDENDEEKRVDAEKEPVLSPQSVASANSTVSNESIQSPASSRSSTEEDRDTRMVESIQSVDSHISTIQSPRGAGIRAMANTPDYTPRLMEAQDTPVSQTTGFLCGCI